MVYIMSYNINTDILIKELSCANEYKLPTEIKVTTPSYSITEGLNFLIDNVLIPLTNGNTVHTRDLDSSKFDKNDLEDMYYFYMENYYDGTREWYMLKNIHDICVKAVAQNIAINFI